MAASPAVGRAKGVLAGTIRHHPDDVERVENARRDLKAAKAENYIKELVDSAPRLSDEQVSRLTLLLRGGS